jgi:hypothetical protein
MDTRKLTKDEYELSLWLLEHGNEDACKYIDQLDNADATIWKCECGCASFNFKVHGQSEAKPGVHILSDYVFGNVSELAGVFIFSSNGVLSGLEVYGLAADAPSNLPKSHQLIPFAEANNA